MVFYSLYTPMTPAYGKKFIDMRAAAIHVGLRDSVMKKMIERIGSVELKPGGDPFTHLCREIVGQQLSGRVADVIHGRFRALYPRRKILRPQEILATPHEKLRACGMANSKAAFLKDLAQKFIDGTIEPRKFAALSDEEVSAELKKVKGIGQWTADMFLIFGLNRLDVFPLGDLGIQKAIQRAYELRKRPSERAMLSLAKKWRPYRTVAARYLWEYIDVKDNGMR